MVSIMRKEFFRLLHAYMAGNPDIFFLTGDLGFGLADAIMKDYPDRAINCGASEQAMLDMATGLALEGKIPFVYSITPFLLYRGFETIRTYINHEVLNVKLIGSGRDEDYKHDGFSHDATDIYHFLDGFVSIGNHYPDTIQELSSLVDKMCKNQHPEFLSLTR